MANFDDAMACRDELIRRASEWGELCDVRVTGRMGHWSVLAFWSRLDAEPRWTVGPEGMDKDRRPFIRHVLATDLHEVRERVARCATADGDVPPLPPSTDPVTADDLGF